MKKLIFNPDNKKYYSEEFIKGFECGVERQYNADMTEKTAKWIPVSEMLPEKSGYYLTTTMYGEVYCDYYAGVNFDRQETVIAWQALPEPYKVE